MNYFFTAATEEQLDLALELWYDLDAFSLQDALDTAVEVAPSLRNYCEIYDTWAASLGNQELFAPLP